jgi:hypothetical protein
LRHRNSLSACESDVEGPAPWTEAAAGTKEFCVHAMTERD